MEALKELTSWMGVFKKTGVYQEVYKISEIADMVKFGDDFNIVGSLHSYNSLALKGYKSVKLVGNEFKSIYLGDGFSVAEDQKTVTFGAAVTVEELMDYLLNFDYRLKNSGNFRKQTVIGAICGGTHGFGKNATIASSVVDYIYIDEDGGTVRSEEVSLMPKRKCIIYCTLEIERVGSYRVAANQKYLDELILNPGEKKAFIVLPYTNEKNPMIIETCYEDLKGKNVAAAYKKSWSVPWSAWKLKLFWAFDSRFRCFRKIVQRILYFFRIPSWEMITDPKDIDSLYHPWPGIDDIAKKPRFSLWAFKPTYTGYNISLFIKSKYVKQAIKEITRVANNKEIIGTSSNFLMSFLACRYLSDSSGVEFVGNYKEEVVAIDMYCHPKHAQQLIWLQKHIQEKFPTRPHRGKTV